MQTREFESPARIPFFAAKSSEKAIIPAANRGANFIFPPCVFHATNVFFESHGEKSKFAPWLLEKLITLNAWQCEKARLHGEKVKFAPWMLLLLMVFSNYLVR